MLSKRHARGQSTAEYAIVVGIVIAAIVGMQLYLKRGMQGKMKAVSDHMASVTGTADPSLAPIGTVLQYEPYYNPASSVAVTSNRSTTEGIDASGVGTTTYSDSTSRTGTQSQGATLTDDDAW